ncbi:MAG: SHOCT-like domain-containing protein, partial [Bacillota bacterium]
MNDERMMILQMLKDGKITPEEANGLLDALNKTEQAQRQAPQQAPHTPGTRPPFPPGTNINNLGVQIGRMIREEITRAVGDPDQAGRAARQVMRSVKDMAHEIRSEVRDAIREAKEQERAQRRGSAPAEPARPSTPAAP